jgi:hypothetical protein
MQAMPFSLTPYMGVKEKIEAGRVKIGYSL